MGASKLTAPLEGWFLQVPIGKNGGEGYLQDQFMPGYV